MKPGTLNVLSPAKLSLNKFDDLEAAFRALIAMPSRAIRKALGDSFRRAQRVLRAPATNPDRCSLANFAGQGLPMLAPDGQASGGCQRLFF
jgi:hypothetical protein